MNLFDYVKLRKNSNVIWDHIAAEINNSDPEDFTDHRTFVNGEVLRSWYKRKKKHEVPVEVTPSVSMPISIPMPFEPILKVPMGMTLVLADLHAPFHDEQFIEEMIKRTLDSVYSLDKIIVAGDTFDFDGLSKYPKDHNVARLETELELGGSLLQYLAQFAPVYLTNGNHCSRLSVKLNAHVDLKRLVNMALNGRTTKHSITTTNRDYLFLGNNYIIGHLTSANSVAGKGAHAIAQKYQRHCLAGHDHIRGVFNVASTFIGASIGCSARTDKFWYSERVMNGHRFMQKGYAIITDENSFDLIDHTHEPYFVRTMFNNSIYNCTKV